MANAVDFNERMQEHIENLVKLQAVELERTRLAQVARALPAEIAEAQAALTAAERLAAEASAALSREESLRSRLDREIGAHRQKAARYRAQQDSLTTPAQANAVEHELHFAEAEAERLENEEFASLERTEAQEAALAAARAKVESLAAALDNTRERISLRQAEVARQQATLTAEREAIRPLIETEWIMRFDRLCASRGTGLARVENSAMHRLPHGRPAPDVEPASRRRAAHCDSCNRLLYWDPSMAPAPAQQPDAKPKRKTAKPPAPED